MTQCPICGNGNSKKPLCKVNLNPGSEYDLTECPNCGVIRFQPLPSVEELARFYSAGYYDFDRSREEGKGMAFARHLNKWKPEGRFLDVGCATGFFINGIKDHSRWEVFGTDFGKSAVEFARQSLGLNVVHGDLAEAAFPDAFFDYVHVNNVLEHVLDPVTLLRECRRIIKPDGIFYLSVPNGFNDSLDLIKFYRVEKKPARSKNGHIFFFQSRTLLGLFDQIGFSVINQKTYSLKRGFRSIGYLRRKRDWKRDYYPREVQEHAVVEKVVIPGNSRRHSNFYYRFKFVQTNFLMVPGLHKFGLDFRFLLKPKN